MIFEVSHRTTYRYGLPVSISHHLVHLQPRNAPWQSCNESLLEMTPAPGVRVADTDYFGNPVTFLTVQQSHRELVFHALSVVEVRKRPAIELTATPRFEEVRARLESDRSDEALDAIQYSFPSSSTPWHAELRDYGLISFPPGRPILAGARDLTRRIHTDFTYDPRATTISTSAQQAFRQRRGVCQDFAHIELACLRALGLPARYVSGYLLTRPKEGRERLVGADASHAWISVWIPGHGWVDLDPTNDLIVGDEHITLAWGRDYGDVSPVSGVMFGGGEHSVRVAVDVVPLTERKAIA
jgi:transglutaminase-like putative cysteine protease